MSETRLLLGIALNTAVIYAFLVIVMRWISRRQMGQLSALDLLVLILLGSAVETAMVRADTSLKAGIVSATTLLLLNKILNSVLLRSKRLRHIVGAGPVLLIHNGQFVEANLRKVGLTKEDCAEAIRAREQSSIKDIRFAVLEPDGEINLVMRSDSKGADPEEAKPHHAP